MGAPSNRLLELSEKFIEDGWEVLVVTAMPNYPEGKISEKYAGKFSAEENIRGIRIKRYWLYASISHRAIPRIISMISFSLTSLFSLPEVRKFRPDFLFAESPPLTLTFSGYILSAISKAKLIMNISDIWPLSAKELGAISDGFLYSTIEKLEKFMYRKAQLCTGQSEEIISHIEKTVPKEKTYLFRNGVDVRRFLRAERNITDVTGFRIIYAGLTGVAQNVLSIVKNINFRGIGAEFHIFGEGSERKEIEKFISENPGRNVFLHKSRSREEIPELLAQFDCALIPLVKNIYGAVPSKIYEAMAAGLPVLFSGSGEGAKIIKDNNTGLVSEPGDFVMLTENILKLKDSPDLRKELSENCRVTAEKKFDRNRLINDFSGKLKKILNKESKRNL